MPSFLLLLLANLAWACLSASTLLLLARVPCLLGIISHRATLPQGILCPNVSLCLPLALGPYSAAGA